MKLYEITFSPTGGTQKAADLLTEALGGERIAVDLTDRTADFSAVAFTPEDVAVIAVPSYGGRVPAAAVAAGDHERQQRPGGAGMRIRQPGL